ncbi:hypothetical protein [Gimesia sp.]|uniref:hypothetical protein n=1 Tax=Gimesia sp. TaxID=2024833 RepID=UPI003A923B71
MTDRNMSDFKEFVSVSEMAALCDLSRQRFHELIGIVFPYPVYLLSNRRPIYDRKLQEVCLRVRSTGRSINGEPVLFYRRRSQQPTRKQRKDTKPQNGNHADLIKSLGALGLAPLDDRQVSQAVREVFPQGTAEVAPGELIRQVFLKLKCERDV